MLKIKAPIGLKCNTDFITVGDGFGNRVLGNYGVIGSGLNPEELLHLVNRPPEIYLGEGGITNLVNESNIQMHQQKKVEIINNFLNRVLVNTDVGLTYQDRVFVTNVLHQLGIKDEKYFMQQVENIKSEVNNTEELVNLYWNNLSHLEQVVREFREGDTVDQSVHEGDTEVNEFHLHESIMNRLQTGAIYQIVQNFNENTEGDRYLSNAEYNLSEQKRITKNILLNRLQNVIRHEEAPLTYLHENIFEETSEEGDNVVTEESVNTQINSAVLLNLIDNVYQTRFESMQRGGDKVYHMESAFYEGADNTLNRITQNVENRLVFTQNINNTEERVEALNEEIDIINNILSETRTEQLRVLTDADYRQYKITNYGGTNVDNRTVRTDVTNRQGDTNLSVTNETVFGETNVAGDVYSKDGDLIVHREGDTNLIEEQITEAQQINNELSLINQQNMIRNQEFRQGLERIEREFRTEKAAPSPKRSFEESLTALEHPEIFLEQIRREPEIARSAAELKQEAVFNLLPERERMTTKLVKEYLERPEVFKNQRIVSESNLTQLMADVTRVESENRLREVKEQNEQITKEVVTDVVSETVREIRKAAPEIKVEERSAERLSLVHKSQESVVDEELIEEIIQQNRRIEQQNNRIDTIVTKNETETKTVIQHQQNNTVIEHVNQIEQAVQQGITGQMDEITEKVYNKLSRRLANEKARRGL